MTDFPVPKYLAGTARSDIGVRDWIAGLPEIVTDLAGRWSLQVGEPFEPGGQCSWTAPVSGPDGVALVLKVGYRFPGGEERDEAAGLRLWDGNGAVRLYAALDSESAYALLTERCMPGIPLGQALPEPEQDLVVTRLLNRLWMQPHGAYPFRPLAQMCAAWAKEFEQEYAAAAAADRIDRGLARAGIDLFLALPQEADNPVLLCTDLHGDNILAAQRAPWLMIDRCKSGCVHARQGWPARLLTWLTVRCRDVYTTLTCMVRVFRTRTCALIQDCWMHKCLSKRDMLT